MILCDLIIIVLNRKNYCILLVGSNKYCGKYIELDIIAHLYHLASGMLGDKITYSRSAWAAQ